MNEMRVVMSLWSMMRSPLVYGGDITAGAGSIPPAVKAVVTNRDMLGLTDDVVQPFMVTLATDERNATVGVARSDDDVCCWAARSHASRDVRYVAVFNLGPKNAAAAAAAPSDQRAVTSTTQMGASGQHSSSGGGGGGGGGSGDRASRHRIPPAVCRPAVYQNNSCMHNPRGRIANLYVANVSECCQACTIYTVEDCVAWSAFHDNGLQCNPVQIGRQPQNDSRLHIR